MNKYTITFFIRAYNDLDCRLPLILYLSKKKKFKINVFFYPTNNSFFNYETYENISLIKKKNIKLYSFINFIYNSNFVKFYFYLSNFFKNLFYDIIFFRKNKFFLKSLVVLDGFFLKYIRYDERKIVSLLKKNIFIFDDIILNKFRSNFILFLEKIKIQKKIYAIQTGQDTYINLKRNNSQKKNKKSELLTSRFFVPSLNDKNIFKNKIQNDIYVLGNTRFEKNWIYYLNRNAKKIKINNCNRYKIVFMLSKLEYGIKLKSLINTLEYLGKMKDVTLILKPHTRGMELKKFFNKNKYSNILNGEQYDSTSLIKWSDQILFTGSSIIFQAMVLNKKCIFLKNCLFVKSIFDQTNSVFKVEKLSQLSDIIRSKKSKKKFVNSFIKKTVYNGNNSDFVNNKLYKTIKKLN